MINLTYNNLDGSTKSFLATIEAANSLFMTDMIPVTEQTIVRARLRDAFEEYFEVLIKTEDRFGIESTERSQEVIQIAIDEFMESEELSGRQSFISDDLDTYSAILTQTLLCATTV